MERRREEGQGNPGGKLLEPEHLLLGLPADGMPNEPPSPAGGHWNVPGVPEQNMVGRDSTRMQVSVPRCPYMPVIRQGRIGEPDRRLSLPFSPLDAGSRIP
jgi:hypothetical protein